MNNWIESLLKQYCPNGVEYKKLRDVGNNFFRGSGIKRTDITEEGIPCVRYGEIYTDYGIWFDKCKSHTILDNVSSLKFFEYGALLFAITGESIIDIAKCTAYVGHEKCLAGGDIVVMEHNEDPKYLSYALSTTDAVMQKGAGKVKSKVVHSSVPAIMDLEVPLPPMEVQREIVRVLDNFTLLRQKLSDELSMELSARRKQYEYYRDQLLDFNENKRGEWCKLLDMLVQPITDGPHTTPTLVENGVPFISAEAVFDGRIHFDKKRGNITEAFDEECCKKYKPQKHDVFMVKSGSTTGKVGYVDIDDRFNIWSPLAALRVNSSNSSRFLFHLLQSSRMQAQVRAKASHGSQPNLSMRTLEQFDVFIPPLEVQIRIADVLDNFEATCNDLNISLPAEIEARTKQYEFYRDQLLTFAESGKTILATGDRRPATGHGAV